MPNRINRPDVLRRCAAALLLLAAATAQAADLGRGFYTLLVENDVFTGTDEHYTNGLRLTYLSHQDDVAPYIRKFAAAVPFLDPDARLRTGYAIGHNIYTPNNTQAVALVPNERPYAGYLYAGMAVVAESDGSFGGILDTWELDLGLVGPWALGEEVQNNFHRLIGSPKARGWDNQLKNEPAAVLTYERKWRHIWQRPIKFLDYDVIPHVGGSLGNVATYLNMGATLRMGRGLERDYGPPRIRPSLPGSGFFMPHDGVGWYFYAGVDGRAMAHNMFLDGNTFSDSHSVNSKTWVGDVQMGLVLTLDSMRIAYTHIYRSPEYKGQKAGDNFGAVSISASF